ncbi:MAG: M4 family metallopeptidase [Ignavibacteriae bacterium]|nr:M4 family metallopeptidase [Ignavibacteriota bacterium]
MYTHILRFLASARPGLILALLATFAASVPAQQPAAFKRRIMERRAAFHGTADAAAAEKVGASLREWTRSSEVLSRRPELRAARGLTPAQILAYDGIARRVAGLRVSWDERGALPISIAAPVLARGYSQAAEADVEAVAAQFFSDFAGLFRLNAASDEFRLLSLTRDESGASHARFAQYHNGVAVWGSEAVLQFSARGDLVLYMGRTRPTPVCSVTPALTRYNAMVTAHNSLPGANTPGFEHEARLVCFAREASDAAALAYEVEFTPTASSRWIVFVDALDGRVLLRYNAACADGPAKGSATDLLGRTRDIDVYLHQGNYYMLDASRPMYRAGESTIPDGPAGAILTLDAQNTDLASVRHVTSASNTWTDASAVSAHAFAGDTYEYFRATHNRNGIDGRGSTIISIVNATDNGQPMENAYWNGRVMVYGNGGATFKPLAGALDVAAHEMTHGVTEHSAGLMYLGQSGALNEAFSDMFAAMVDRDDWRIGEDVVRTGTPYPSGALRDMADPHNGASSGSPAWQPKHMNEFVVLSDAEDNGGVHVNSGIPNHAAYLLSQSIGREKAEKILYRALTTKLTMQSRFVDFRLALIRSADELHGTGSPESAACAAACDQVGIVDGSGTRPPADLPPVNGADRLLFVSTDVSDPVYLWTVQPPAGPSDFTSISSTPVFSRPSVADDGSVAVFIDFEGNIRAVSLDPAAPNEQIIDSSGIWGSLALSRDKRLLALTSLLQEPSIYVIDLGAATPDAREFTLYCPTYSGEGLPDVAKYPDAMDFSPDNTSLLYDVYNEITVGTAPIGFWEINLLSVWDAKNTSFGSGTIYRLFPQETGIDLGNATFARNSQNVIVFDAKDNGSNEGAIAAANLLTDEVSLIARVAHTEPGTPSYRGDDRVVSFSSSALSSSGRDSIYTVDVAADRVTALGAPQGFVPSGIYPIWYRRGLRPSAIGETAPARGTWILEGNYPNPFNPSTSIRFTAPSAGDVRLSVYDVMGREIAVLLSGTVSEGTHIVQWDGTDASGRACASGLYIARLRNAKGVSTLHMLLAQ